jgi:hypothetical protein
VEIHNWYGHGYDIRKEQIINGLGSTLKLLKEKLKLIDFKHSCM